MTSHGGMGGMGTMGGGLGPPMSRGGMMTSGGGAAPPGTRQGLGSRQGIGTRQGTAARVPMGVGAVSDVQVHDRPTTQQGLSGMKTGSLGPKRQVYDKTYYMLELRKRCTDLQEEITTMTKEAELIRNDNQLYVNLEKRYDALAKTVRDLEGNLADHNLAADKQRTDTRPEEVHHMYMIMKQANEQQRSDVDQIFLEKKGTEEETQRMDMEIASLERASEARLMELHPEQHREYQSLRQENIEMGPELGEARADFDAISERLQMMEMHLQSDANRARMQQLTIVRQELGERLDELEVQARQCSLSVPEQREILLAKVKSDNGEIVAAEKKVSDLRMEKEQLKSRMQEVQQESQEKKDDSDRQKCEILFAKDQEMTQFIDGFADTKKDEETKLKDKQDSITKLLESISKSLAISGGDSSGLEGHLRDMEDELEFKNRHLQTSETTQSRLEGELVKRQGELEKIDTLDGKISDELQQVQAKKVAYEEEIMEKFDRVDEMRASGEMILAGLTDRKSYLDGRNLTLRQQVGLLKLKRDSRKQQLADDEVAAGLDNQENKIKQYGQNLNALTSFLSQKEAETNKEGETAVCIDCAAQLNKMLLERRY
eukprot:TRINITY_DN74160_c0_g1_i1.p1 TRINITY_DN74160_c0_g1~~TRINITY_DN74160_c0_g1_i1.p1  ORF type:complete len:602 (+),score=177.09 TRINITY_DN74160_c0_g1_i1:325-2130(+)